MAENRRMVSSELMMWKWLWLTFRHYLSICLKDYKQLHQLGYLAFRPRLEPGVS